MLLYVLLVSMEMACPAQFPCVIFCDLLCSTTGIKTLKPQTRSTGIVSRCVGVVLVQEEMQLYRLDETGHIWSSLYCKHCGHEKGFVLFA